MAGSKKKLDRLVDDALAILEAFGIPLADQTEHRQVRMAKAFLAVAGMTKRSSWEDAKSNDDGHRLRSREVLAWMNQYLDENISPGSYDDIRRRDLILPVTAGVVLKSAKNADAATNDGTRAYALNPEFARQIRRFGSPEWLSGLERLMSGKQSLVDELRRERDLARLPVTINGREIKFSPGEHNQIQKAVIEKFLPYFGHQAQVLYVGDTDNKSLFLDAAGLNKLGFFELSHDKLPDVLAYSASENWLYLIEAVHSANPIDGLRKLMLERLAGTCNAGIVFVTAFLTRASFRKFAAEIAWETEVWIADEPTHLIHYNGDRFLGPHVT